MSCLQLKVRIKTLITFYLLIFETKIKKKSDCHRERAPIDAARFDKESLKKTETKESAFLDKEKSILVRFLKKLKT